MPAKNMKQIEEDREVLREELKLMEREIAKRRQEAKKNQDYLDVEKEDQKNVDFQNMKRDRDFERRKELE